jgi:hypothetical protein
MYRMPLKQQLPTGSKTAFFIRKKKVDFVMQTGICFSRCVLIVNKKELRGCMLGTHSWRMLWSVAGRVYWACKYLPFPTAHQADTVPGAIMIQPRWQLANNHDYR